jgi:SAM-dependent methyltransferase
MTAKFDRYGDSYRSNVEQAVSFSGQGLDFYTEAKVVALCRVVRRRLGPLDRLTALDVGCGTGEADRLLAPWLGKLHGVDVSRGVLNAAALANPEVDYRVTDGSSLPFEDRSLDVCFAFCVLHHVPPSDRPTLVDEMRRVTRPGGLVVIAEHNPLNPLTRLAVSRCEFDDDAILLQLRDTVRTVEAVGMWVAERRYILFFPWRVRVLRRIEGALRRLPLGAQYVVSATP